MSYRTTHTHTQIYIHTYMSCTTIPAAALSCLSGPHSTGVHINMYMSYICIYVGVHNMYMYMCIRV